MINELKKIKDILPHKDKWKLVLLFVFMVTGAVLEAFSISIVAGFVAVVADPKILFGIEILSGVLDFLEIKESQDVIIYGAVFLILVFFLKNTYLVFYRYIKNRFIFNRYKNISSRLFNVYMNVPYSFHLRRNSAEIIRNVNEESRIFALNVILPFLQIMTETVIIIAIITLLFIVEPAVTVGTIVILGGVSFLFLKVTKNRMHRYGLRALEERGRSIKAVNEGVGGFKDATIMNRQGWFLKRFEKSIELLARSHIFQQTIKQSVKPVIETIAVTGVLLIALTLLMKGYSIGVLASVLALFVLSLQRLLPAVNEIISSYNGLRYNIYALNPIHKDLTTLEEEVKNKKKKGKKLKLKKEITLKDVSFAYHESEEVLKNISLSVKKGSAVGLVGSTGSGKTTLVDVILGLLEPIKGKVLVDKKDIRENICEWQKNIGYIPQSIYLSDDTIRNNIAFGIDEKEVDEEKVKKAVKVAQLNEFVDKLKDGVDTFIGERGIRLSGGQRQRIGIARALYDNPEVLIMDEATSSLDNITEKFVIKAIEQLKKERTIIIVAHRLTTVKNCDKLYIIKNGQIIAEGSYSELLEKSEDFKEMN
ncbi:MAG: ABC transporter ATP-binding protein/permease, partial [Candidatus Pacebacteria bacterium]|nr:ABC transporter ATP-binding protein/permease [Candidatus Paceibacterota bacterium]